MNHEEAEQIKAPERYVIGDLSQAERDEFEDHFAACPQCIDDVWTMSAFAANARAEFRDRAAKPAGRARAGWLAWFRPEILIPSLAALALAVVAGYQNMAVIPSLKAPQSLATVVILDGTTRASVPQAPAGNPVRCQIALEPSPTDGTVYVELADSSGTVLSSGLVKSPAPDQPLDVYFPLKLKEGRYTVVIRAEQTGRRGQELARSQFEITPQGVGTR